MNACAHHIPFTKDCPWCRRKSDKSFKPKKPFQVYQLAFDEFMAELKEDSLGPSCVVFLSEDLNGKLYIYTDGHEEKILALIKKLNEALKEAKCST